MLRLHHLAAPAIAAAFTLTLSGCGKPPQGSTPAAPGDAVAPAMSAPTQGAAAGPAAPVVRRPDGGEDLDVGKYAEQLKRDPALYAKQKEICHNAGPHAQPPALEAPCAAFDAARADLEEQSIDQDSRVTNRDSL
jgi:hypothetical protein